MRTVLAVVILSLMAGLAHSAEYNGRIVDGQTYSGSAFSYGTSNYYYVDVEFDGEDCTIYFSNGGYITVTLDDEEIDDPHNISAFDYNESVYWDLDVDGLE